MNRPSSLVLVLLALLTAGCATTPHDATGGIAGKGVAEVGPSAVPAVTAHLSDLATSEPGRRPVREGKCFCPLANASYTNMLASYQTVARVLGTLCTRRPWRSRGIAIKASARGSAPNRWYCGQWRRRRIS